MKVYVTSESSFDQLDRVEANLGDLTQLREEIGNYFVASTIQIFEEQGPEGQKWPDLAPGTWQQKKGKMILQDMGLLKAGVMYWVDGENVWIGPSGPSTIYSRIQQKGGWAGPGRSVYIQPRPYLVITEGNKEYIHQLGQEHLKK